MKHLKTLTLVGVLLAGVAQAEDDEGFNLMEEGARLFMRGLMSEMEPALDEFEQMARDFEPAMRGLVEQMGPALQELAAKVDDFRYYQAPELLDNGDIIIRRSPEAPPIGFGENWLDAPSVVDEAPVEL